mgnify:CR=1 FL=1
MLMYDAASALPMQHSESDDLPWTLWCYKSPLSLLQRQMNTDRRSVSEERNEEMPSISTFPPQPYVPPTHRYHAVWANLEQKARKAGNYAAWSK